MKVNYFFVFFLLVLILSVRGETIFSPRWTLGLNKEIYTIQSTAKFIAVGLENSFYLWDKEGDLRWNYSLEEKVNNIILDDKSLVGSPHHFYLFDLQGNLKLKHEINASWIGFPKVMDMSPDGIAIGFMDGYLHFYDFNGKERWKHKLDAYVIAVKILDKRVIGISDKQIYIFDKSGKLKDKISPSKRNYIHSAFIDKTFIGISLGNGVVEIYNQDGKKWEQQFPDKIGTLFIWNNYLAMGSKGGYLYLFDLKRGKVKWQKKLSQAVVEVQIAADKIFASTLDDQIYVFHLYNGNLEGKFALGGKEKLSAFSSSPQDFIVGTTLGKLYYFSLQKEINPDLSLFVLIVLFLVVAFSMVMLVKAVR